MMQQSVHIYFGHTNSAMVLWHFATSNAIPRTTGLFFVWDSWITRHKGSEYSIAKTIIAFLCAASLVRNSKSSSKGPCGEHTSKIVPFTEMESCTLVVPFFSASSWTKKVCMLSQLDNHHSAQSLQIVQRVEMYFGGTETAWCRFFKCANQRLLLALCLFACKMAGPNSKVFSSRSSRDLTINCWTMENVGGCQEERQTNLCTIIQHVRWTWYPSCLW